MKVLYIIDTLTKMGGAERSLIQLTLGLKERGCESMVFCLKGGPLIHTLSKQGIEVADLQLRRIYDFTAVGTILRLARFARRRRIDLIVTYHDGSDFLGLMVSKICRIPIISNRRDMGFSLKRRHIMIYRLVNRFFYEIIAVSEAVKRILCEKQKADPQKINVVYNGMDPSMFSIEADRSKAKEELGLNLGQPVVGCLANIRTIKGHKYLIKAAGKVLNEMPDVQFLLVGGYDVAGGDECYQEIVDLLRKIGIGRNVLFAGERDDIPTMLSLMDISVIPSLSEGFSNTILESMAAGKPVVATNVGGNAEAVIDGKTGILVPPADPTALARSMVTLLKNRELAKKIGESGRQRVVKQFTLHQMILAYEEIFHFAIKRKKLNPKINIPELCTHIKRHSVKMFKLMLSMLLYYSGFILLFQKVKNVTGKAEVKILAYHNINNTYSRYLDICQSIDTFESQIEFIKHNYDIISLHHAVTLLKQNGNFNRDKLVVTFDDSYKDFYTTVFPILKKHKTPATIFLTVGPLIHISPFPFLVDALVYAIHNTNKDILDLTSLGLRSYLLETLSQKRQAIFEIEKSLRFHSSPRREQYLELVFSKLAIDKENPDIKGLFLSWEDIESMENGGIDIGAHTITHPVLSKIPINEMEYEIRESKRLIEERLGIKVSAFAYPYGEIDDFDINAIDLVKSVGFSCACTMVRGKNNSNFFTLHRIPVDIAMSTGLSADFSKPLFALELSGLADYVFLRFLKHSQKCATGNRKATSANRL